MKSKLLVAAMICFAVAACEKESKEKTTVITPPAPSAPANPDHPAPPPAPAHPEQRSMYENDANVLAAEEQNAQAAPSAELDANKTQEMQQDASTLSQAQDSNNAQLEQAAQ